MEGDTVLERQMKCNGGELKRVKADGDTTSKKQNKCSGVEEQSITDRRSYAAFLAISTMATEYD